MGKVVVFGQKSLNSGKSSCNRAKMVVFGENWFYLGKSGVIGQSGCIRARW